MSLSFPSFGVISVCCEDEFADLTIMCHGKRFNVSFPVENLRGPQSEGESLEQKFSTFREELDDDPAALNYFEEWVVEACIPILRQLAPARKNSDPPLLQEYFNPTTVFLTLKNMDGRLEAMLIPDKSQLPDGIVPRISMPNDLASLLYSHSIPCFPASEVRMVLRRGDDEKDFEIEEMPQIVEIASGNHGPDPNRQYCFKPAFEEQSFQREVRALLRIKNNLPAESRVSSLAGLVMYEDGVTIMGLLIDYLHDSQTLDTIMWNNPSKSEREKWAQQIQDTITKLHSIDVIWGDVKPDNVLVDSGGNAVVIDFGGGFARGWGEKESSGTMEGDWSGFERIKDFLGL